MGLIVQCTHSLKNEASDTFFQGHIGWGHFVTPSTLFILYVVFAQSSIINYSYVFSWTDEYLVWDPSPYAGIEVGFVYIYLVY
jgi:hypothetical protein